MALISKAIVIDGVQRGTEFTLEKAGDLFPVHTHTSDDIHYTIVAFGSVECYGRPAIEGRILTAKCRPEENSTIINWKAGEAHGFRAKTDGATLINIFKTPKI